MREGDFVLSRGRSVGMTNLPARLVVLSEARPFDSLRSLRAGAAGEVEGSRQLCTTLHESAHEQVGPDGIRPCEILPLALPLRGIARSG